MLCVKSQSRRSDLVSVGEILSEMLEKWPDARQADAVEFQKRCVDQCQTATTLLNHRFLQQEPSHATLVHYVFVTGMVVIPSFVTVYGKVRNDSDTHGQ